MYFNHRFIIIIMAIIIFGSSFSYISAAKAEAKNQVILILINQLAFTDEALYIKISGFQTLDQLAAKGAMNINSGGSRNDVNSYLSIGGGSRANGLKEMEKSYLAYETIDNEKTLAKERFKQITGRRIYEENTILFLPIEQFKQSDIQRFPYKIGALGDALKAEELIVKVYGDNDTNQKRRLGPLITMDSQGISYGVIGAETNIVDLARPYGKKTSYTYLLEQLRNNTDASLLVFDLGDLYRLEALNDNMSREHAEYIKNTVFKEIGNFIQAVINELNNNQTLIVASPMVNREAIRENMLLSPIWLYNKQQYGSLLTSSTTKREGVVANIDIAATILSQLQINNKPIEIIGQQIEVIHSRIDLKNEIEHIIAIYSLRSAVLYPYVMWQVIILILAIVNWFWYKDKLFSWIKLGLIGILLLPLLILITGFITPVNASIYIITLIAISIILAKTFLMLPVERTFFWIGLITFLALTIDIFNGAQLIKRSFLGYDPIIGARYYGIGNEYMGVYIGTLLLFTGSLAQIKRNYFTIGIIGALYGLGCFVLIYPTLGTNAGGAISAILATIVAYLNILQIKWSRGTTFVVILLLSIGFGVLVVANYYVVEESQSHIGRALNQLFSGDISVIGQTIQRKLEMNWKLIKVSAWSRVMITSIIALGLLFLRPRSSLKKLKKDYPGMFWGFYGIVVGAVVSLIVNDSGVVAASTLIIYVVVPLLYLSLVLQKEQKG